MVSQLLQFFKLYHNFQEFFIYFKNFLIPSKFFFKKVFSINWFKYVHITQKLTAVLKIIKRKISNLPVA